MAERTEPAEDPAVQEGAVREGAMDGGAAVPPLGTRLGHRPVLHAVLARKVLDLHLRNRNLLLDPPPSNLRGLPAAEAARLIRAMAAAAHADGNVDAGERRRLRTALATSALEPEERDRLERELEAPPRLEDLLRSLSTAQEASRVYAISLAAVSKSSAVNRAYLRYLAQRLALPGDLVVRLNRRFNLRA